MYLNLPDSIFPKVSLNSGRGDKSKVVFVLHKIHHEVSSTWFHGWVQRANNDRSRVNQSPSMDGDLKGAIDKS